MNIESIFLIGLVVITIITTVIYFIFKNRTTRPLILFCLILEVVIYSAIIKINPVDISYLKIFFVITIFTISLIIRFINLSKNRIEFGNYQILSFNYFYNIIVRNNITKSQKRLGTVIPYSKATLNLGGRHILFPEINSRGGTMVTGASGSGKSVQIMELIKQDMNDSRPVVFFNYKGDRGSSDDLKKEAISRGYTIYSLDEENMYSFDPLIDISPTGRVEALLNMRKWSMDGADAHFRTNTQLLMQKYITEYDKFYFSENRDMPYTYGLYEYIIKRKPDLSNRSVSDAYKTFTTLLEIILTSKAGDSIKAKYSRTFSFKNSFEYNEKFILIISIPSDSKEFANSISSLYFRNLMAQGTTQEYSPAIAVYIDEFGSLENPFVVKDILEKGRSCGIMTTIAIQDVYQIVINTNEAYLNSLLGTINNFFIFAGATREAAVKMAGVQIREVEGILQTLMKPLDSSPTACFITKIPTLDRKKSAEVYKYVPYVKGTKTKLNFKSINSDEIIMNDTDKEFSDVSNSSYYDKSRSKNELLKEIKKEKNKKADDEFDSFLDDMGL